MSLKHKHGLVGLRLVCSQNSFKAKLARESLPLRDALRYVHRSASSAGEEAVLKNLIWGLGVQKGSGTYPSAQILNCPCLRLFWKMPSEIPRHRSLWMKFLSCSGRRGRYCTSKAMPPCLAAETRKQGQRWVDLNVFKAWKPAAAPSGASVASNHVHGLAS